jgi:hypothetical protein
MENSVPSGSMARQTADRCESSTCKTERKRLQQAKIREIGEALVECGFDHIDQQSKALNVPRSTAWFIANAKYKASGLSASIIRNMLTSADLPPPVKKTIFEYIDEKTDGLYGHSETQIHRFQIKLAEYGIVPRSTSPARSGRERHLKRSTGKTAPK